MKILTGLEIVAIARIGFKNGCIATQKFAIDNPVIIDPENYRKKMNEYLELKELENSEEILKLFGEA